MAAPVYRLRTPTGTGAEMLQFKSANGSRASRRWAKSGKTKTFPRGRRLKVYRASRWSAIGIIGDPAQKTVLDEAGFLMEAFTRYLLQFPKYLPRIRRPARHRVHVA